MLIIPRTSTVSMRPCPQCRRPYGEAMWRSGLGLLPVILPPFVLNFQRVEESEAHQSGNKHASLRLTKRTFSCPGLTGIEVLVDGFMSLISVVASCGLGVMRCATIYVPDGNPAGMESTV